MKALTLTILLTGCASTHEDKAEQVMNQVEISGMQTHGFCQGKKLHSYIETKHYYQFTCSDGGYYMLPKE